jgi:RNA polymerase sigma-70 factor, ECF subfamily
MRPIRPDLCQAGWNPWLQNAGETSLPANPTSGCTSYTSYATFTRMVSSQGVTLSRGESPRLAEALRLAAQGDQSALGELYDATSSMVMGVIRRIVMDPSAAEELTIDVYTQVWRLASTYSEEKGAPITWLLMLARSRSIDYLRSRSRKSKELETPIESALDVSHPGPNPETEAVSECRRRAIEEALSNLPLEQLEVLRLAFFGGLSHTEIAEMTKKPLGTIKTRLRTGMERMRELLQPLKGSR